MIKVAAIIIIIGLWLNIFQTATYYNKEKIMSIGEIVITRNKPHTLIWSPLLGIIVLLIGGHIYWKSFKKPIVH